jgi:hypothetical protein
MLARSSSEPSVVSLFSAPTIPLPVEVHTMSVLSCAACQTMLLKNKTCRSISKKSFTRPPVCNFAHFPDSWHIICLPFAGGCQDCSVGIFWHCGHSLCFHHCCLLLCLTLLPASLLHHCLGWDHLFYPLLTPLFPLGGCF